MSQRIPTGGPAFPGNHSYIDGMSSNYEGMTLRDWFAGRAMQSIVNNTIEWTREEIAANAYKLADAMLAEKFKAEEANARARREEDNDALPW